MSAPRLTAAFATPADYLAAHEAEVTAGGLLARGATLPPGAASSSCTLVIRIAEREVAELPATIASVALGTGVAVIFLSEPAALIELAARLREPPEEAHAPSSLEFEKLTLADRIRLAQSGGREQRIAILRGPHKQLHAHVLKNPRLTVDEVQWAARQPALAPEALKMISEHPEWSQNAVIATALVRNPKTPLPLALRLLPRLPATELRSIAKGNARPPLVQAAKKLVVT